MLRKNTIFMVLPAALFLLMVAVGMLFLRGDEDTWICANGAWIKHGNPSAPMPNEPCGAQGNSGVRGVVLLGPVCPVQRVGDASCDDKPYATSIEIYRMDGGDGFVIKMVNTINSNTEGIFSIPLQPGSYLLEPAGGNVLPRCERQKVEVRAGSFTDITLSCDTGIR